MLSVKARKHEELVQRCNTAVSYLESSAWLLNYESDALPLS